MKEIVVLKKTGGSLCLHLSKAFKRSGTYWHEGQYVSIESIDKDTLVLSRLKIKNRALQLVEKDSTN